jgi:5-methylcytosine-specific restriction protein A
VAGNGKLPPGKEERAVTNRIRGRALQERRELMMQLDPLCGRCRDKGRVTLWTELDHVVPLHKGGEDILENCQGLCSACHRDKTAEDLGHRKRAAIGLDGWPFEG